MSGRLASFRGPSTPTSSPAKQVQSPQSPLRPTESTYHRKVRTILQDLRTVAENWDDIVLVDGVKAAQGLIDARTELDNELALVPAGTQPRHRLVEPKLSVMEKRIEQLDTLIVKLRKQFQRMNSLVDSLEGVLIEAYKAKGWQFVQDPLWATWSLEKFATSVPVILVHYHRSLRMHVEVVDTLRSHSVSFDVSRESLSRWIAQPYLEENSWEAEWEDLCEAEIERWNSTK